MLAFQRHGFGDDLDDRRRHLDTGLYDPSQKQLLWRGSASETIHKSSSPEKNQERLDKGMAKLLKKFPPGAAQ